MSRRPFVFCVEIIPKEIGSYSLKHDKLFSKTQLLHFVIVVVIVLLHLLLYFCMAPLSRCKVKVNVDLYSALS